MKRTYELLTLSARTPSALGQAERNLAEHRRENPGQSLADLAYTLHVGRRAFPWRLALVAAPGAEPALLEAGEAIAEPKVAFLFTGHGAQHAGMGRLLYETCPIYRRELDRCCDILAPYFPAGIHPHELTEAQLQEMEYAQPALFALEYALAQVWLSWGVKPAVVMGHSLGEYVAAAVAGALPLEEALLLVVTRGRLLQSRCEPGGMLSVLLTPAEAAPYLSDEITVAAINAPRQVVLTGRQAALDLLAARLDRDGVNYRRVAISRSSHSPLTEPMLDAFEARAALAAPGQQQIPIISNLTGQVLEGPPDARYWRRHLRETVRFADGVAAAAAAGVNIFLEIGPHPVLRSLVDQAGLPGAIAAASLRRGEDDWQMLLGGLGRLWAHGVSPDWEAFDAGRDCRRVHAPTYAFDRDSYWLGSAPAADAAAAALMTEPATAPGATTEERLAEIWRSVLGRTPAAPADSFWGLGGDSLTMLQVRSRIQQAFGAEPALADLFAAATFGEMLTLVRRLTGEHEDEGALRPLPRVGHLPLSFAQQRLWFMDRLEPGNPFYNIPMALRLKGALDQAALEGALTEIFRRHEALRTVFAEAEGSPVQVILPPPAIVLPVVPVATEAEALAAALADIRRPFDLSRDLMLRPLLLRLGPDDHILSLTQHHIASDGWSLGILMRELAALYEAALQGAPSPLPPLPVQYADFSAWQRHWLQGPELERLQAYWLERLSGELPVLQLPADRPRPAVQSYNGGVEIGRLDAGLTAALKQLAGAEGATLYMVLLAGYLALLHRSTGQLDLIVGSPAAGRPRVETEGLIGFFASTLVLRTDLAGEPTFRELLARVRESALGAYAHQDLPFEQLVELVQPERNLSYSPIFQAMFSLVNSPMPDLSLGALTISTVDLDPGTARFDLTFMTREEGGELTVVAEYNTDLFDAETIRRMLARWQTLLEGAVADPSRSVATLPFMPRAEQRLLLGPWSQTAPGSADGLTIAEMLAEQARRTPTATALIYGEQRFTYAELHRRAGRLAHFLRQQGVGPEVLVGIKLNRTPDLVIAMLAVVKAGGAYVPLDPNYPEERIAFMVEDSKCHLVIDTAFLTENAAAIAACPETAPAVDLDPENLIYVIYTSGSTGRPKGVAITHRSVAELMEWVREHYSDEELSGVLFSTSVSFDISVFELYGTLCWGGAMIMAENALQLPELPAKNEVRLINTAPSAGAELVRQQAIGPSVITVNLCGEALTRSLARGLYAIPTVRKVINLYGPTEDTVYSTWTVVDRDGEQPPTIGRPLPGTRVFILDAHMQPVPIGVAGELWLAGRGLARGYLHRPELTEERFPTTAYGRIYRTGDLVRWLPTGEMEFLGRVDHQIKIRGFRIELGEVQEALLAHPAISEAVVVVRQESLAAYFSADRDLTVPELRTLLGRRLPEYMIPTAFVQMAQLPKTPNGKVDRKALPAPAQEQPGASAAPSTPTEERLAALWCAVLRREQVGVADDFFELGGHSLMAAQLITRIRTEFGVQLPLRAIFAQPTVAALAALLTPETAPEQAAPPVPVTPPVAPVTTAPLSFAQRRLWFLDQFEPGSPYYNVPAALRLTGALNAGALKASLNSIVQRHEALRTTFITDEAGEPLQAVAATLELDLPLVDLADRPDPESVALEMARAEASRPFDLGAGPLLRATLLRLAPTEHFLLLTMHHIVSDLWSFGVLFQELATLYRAHAEGNAVTLPPLPLQYPEYARWQRERLDGPRMAEQLAYWKQRLTGAPTSLDLLTDRPRPPVKTYNGAMTSPIRLTPELTATLRKLSRREGASLYMTLLAAFYALVRRYSGQTDICVGTPVAGRSRQDLEPLIGVFISTLVLRADLAGSPTFRELLGRVRENVFSDFEHQDLPFENLVEALQPVRDISRSPLFQVFFALQNAPMEPMQLPGLTLSEVHAPNGTAKFDLSLFLEEDGGTLTAVMDYNSDLFDGSTIERMLGHYVTLLAAAAADPDQPVERLPLLPAAEQRKLLETMSQTGPGTAHGLTIAGLLAEQARRTPTATALIYGEQRFSYAELHGRAGRLAHYLRQQGVGPDVLVGVKLNRTPDLVIAMLAVVKAGGAYVPLDPNYPEERIAFMIEDSGLRLVIDAEFLARHAGAIAACPESAPAAHLDPENLIYVIYTSGSTGRPKGVAITHRSVAELMHWVRAHYTDEELSAVLFSTSVCFDISVFELYGTLCWGGAMILAENALQLPDLPAKNEVRLINTAPSAGAELVRQQAIPASVITVNLCGEALTRSLARGLYAIPTVQKVVNLYGPTEDTVYSTWTVVDRDGEQPPTIGRPLPGTQVYILDVHMQPAPIGVAGELWLAGRGLARGYLHRPELTEERFPTTAAYGRIYRTGDLVRWLPNGEMEFLGRLDHQVKIRGFRIELGEVQEALLAHPAISEAVVVARHESLAAYFAADRILTAGELRTLLGKRLPDYMVPAAFVQMAQLPKTPNGKIDRKALPAPEQEQTQSSAAPRTPAEARMAALWCDVLGREQVGVEEDFFDLGGHSLMAARLITRIRTEFGMELPLRAIFSHPTVAALTAVVTAAAAPQPEAPLAEGPEEPDAPDLAPLSFAQRRIWFLDQFEPGSASFNMPAGVRLSGTLNVAALAAGLKTIVQRHAALRTTFAAGPDGEPQQIIAPAMDLPLPLHDLTGHPDPEAEAQALARAEAARPFDLSTGPLIRAALLRLAPTEHILLVTMHHIVSDRWSYGVLDQELIALYRAHAERRPAALPPLPMQYADFARWQRQWLEGARMEAQLAYWQQRLAGAPAALDLPTDRPRPAVKTYRGANCPFRLSPGLAASLRQISRQEGATLYMTLLAAFQVLLGRYTGQTDISVGTPVAGRTREEHEALIGIFVSTLVMRTDLSGNLPFRELLARVRENVLNDFSHQDLPFENLVEALQPVRDTSRTPLFQVMFTLQNTPSGATELPGLTFRGFDAESGTAKFDLTLYITEVGDGLTGVMEYNTDLFDRTTIERMVGHLQTLLAGIAADPQTPVANLPLLTAAERQQLLVAWNDTARAYPTDICLHQLIEAQVAQTPDAEAVAFEGERLSYRELNRRANQLAHRLRKLGVGPDVPVGIGMERSIEMVVGLLAILKAGGAYVPLDPTYPQERLAFMLEDAEAPVVLTPAWLAATDLSGEPESNPANLTSPANTAYIIFTSGSTGRPKGVMVPHAGIVNRLLWMQEEYQLTPADRVMQKTTFCFDVSVWEFFWPLMTGATLVVARPEGHKDSAYLAGLIRDEQITTMHFVPSMLQVFAEEPELAACQSLRQVMCSGEALPPDLVERFYDRAPAKAMLHNLYGPTEASVDVTYWACPRDGKPESVPIGRPVANTQMYVLDHYLQPVPVGVAGELHIGGVQLATGYLKRPDLTAEKFIQSPFGDGRLYKTGDLARYRPDGAIEYLGRIDHQVKIRGFRIELGEIEALLSRHPGVHETVVVAREDVPGDKRLVAYVVPTAAGAAADELREFLRAGLPDYMLPAHFVMLEAMPLSANGKLDRKALPAPQVAAAAGRIPPRTPRELQLLPVWESVLGVSPIGVEDNFFELGGHSLMVVKLLNAVREATGRQLPVASLFQGPTIAQQAVRLDQQDGDRPWTPVVPIRTTGDRPPFFCAHGGFGSIFCFADLARELGPDQPFYGLQPRGLYDDQEPLRSVPEMAARYVAAIREVQPHGPYYLGGYCMGGLVAQQMARLLTEAGEEVRVAVMLDSKLPNPADGPDLGPDDEFWLRALAADERWESMLDEERWADAWHSFEEAGGMLPPGITDVAGFRRWFRVYRANTGANWSYQLAFAPSPVVHFVAREQPGDPELGWQEHQARITTTYVPGDHDTMLQPPHVRELAAQLRAILTRAAGGQL
ncbi:MAG: tycC3 [Symbiobacteriaceae bacterium]|jgi:amino acid adenylation domain-containing protein|nr:tycC3 [Symbiobacteriaceae bacterium]